MDVRQSANDTTVQLGHTDASDEEQDRTPNESHSNISDIGTVSLPPTSRSSATARFTNGSSSGYTGTGSDSITSGESSESYLPGSGSEMEDVGRDESESVREED